MAVDRSKEIDVAATNDGFRTGDDIIVHRYWKPDVRCKVLRTMGRQYVVTEGGVYHAGQCDRADAAEGGLA